MLWIHIILLAAVVATPVVLGVVFRHGPGRSLKELWPAFWPFLFLAGLSVLILNAKGKPFNEWLFPQLAALLLVVACRNERAYQISWWSLFGISVVLCVNFLTLIGDPAYVRNASMTQTIQRHLRTGEAQDALDKAFSADAEFEPGPVSKMLKDPKYDNVELPSPEPTWHTGLTWVYVWKRDNWMIWYPGGAIRSGRAHLEFRKVTD